MTIARACLSIAVFLVLWPSAGRSTVRSVGPGQAYAVPSAAAAAAQDGDTINIDAGVYVGDVCRWYDNHLLIRGVGGYAHLQANGAYVEGKGIWVIKGDSTTVEWIEFSGATVPDQNGAGIRQEGTGLTVRHCYFHDNEDGILCGADASSDILIEYTQFQGNGFGDGFSHNLYIGHVRSLTFRYNYSHHARIGHNLKSRAANNYVLYNRIMDETTGNSSYLIDLPNGGRSHIIGNLLHQGVHTDNSTMISYGAEGLSNPETDLYVINNSMVNDRFTGTFVRVQSGAVPAVVMNNIFVGNGTILNGPGTQTTNLVTDTPGFVDGAQFDYRLMAGSAAIDAGTLPGSAHGFDLAPTNQYVHATDQETRLRQGAIDIGAYEYATPAGVDDDVRPDQFALHQNFPNPFNPSTTIGYTLEQPAQVRLEIFDVTGRRVRTLTDDTRAVGSHTVIWDGMDEYGRGVASGVYFYRLSAGGESLNRKLLLLR